MNGEVKVGFTAGKENQLTELKEIYVEKDGKKTALTVNTIRFHKGNALIKFNEINSIDDAIELKGTFLKAEKNKLKTMLDEDEFYVEDLVGVQAFNLKGELIGEIKQVINQGGGSILSIKDAEKNEFLVPFVKELVPEIDMEQRKVIINDIPGLIEKNNEI